MSMIQDILQQLGDWQMNTESYGDIANISQSDIAAAMTSGFGAAGEFMNPQMFQTIGTGVLEGGRARTYTPMIEATGQSYLQDLLEGMGGEKSKQAYGGFAGSSQQKRFTRGARDEYGKSMQDVLSDVNYQMAESQQSVLDIMNQWRETTLALKGDM